MKKHLIYARQFWRRVVSPGDTLIDATAGNGHDTLFLASLLQGHGSVSSYDIQPQALENTRKRLEELPPEYRECISLKLQSHTQFDEQNVKLIVYNLGYLPGGDKRVTTCRTSTVESIEKGLKILAPGGALSITCYPGHEEGAREQEAILSFLGALSPQWQICHYQWIEPPCQRSWTLSPSLLWLQALPCA